MDTHWAYKLAENLASENQGQIVCAAGVSPSGPVHLGNLREVMTTNLVYKALQDIGADTKFIFSWDDFDRLRKVPAGMPQHLSGNIGMAYTSIPDPEGKEESYAKKFENQFEKELAKIAIHPQFRYQTEMYKSGKYDNQIKKALQNRKNIGHILSNHMTQGMSESQLEKYFPITVYSRFTNKDHTTILAYDGENKLTYRCNETGEIEEIDFTKEHIVKLPWKVDWAMRWAYENVTFEPGGPDHATPGSSFDVSSKITKAIFGNEAPAFQMYQFIKIKGQSVKMSSSSGKVLTLKNALEIYPPELINWLYARVSPEKGFDLAFDQDVIRGYSEFDREITEIENNKSNVAKEQAINLSLNGQTINQVKQPVPFRQVAGISDATEFNVEKIIELAKREDNSLNEEVLTQTIGRAKNWLTNYFKQGRHEIIETPNNNYYATMDENQIKNMMQLKELIHSKDAMTQSEIEEKIYQIPKREGMNDKEKKKAQSAFFKDTYNLLFFKDRGPRLPTFIWAIQAKDKLEKLLQF